jgi:hypothetical protein
MQRQTTDVLPQYPSDLEPDEAEVEATPVVLQADETEEEWADTSGSIIVEETSPEADHLPAEEGGPVPANPAAAWLSQRNMIIAGVVLLLLLCCCCAALLGGGFLAYMEELLPASAVPVAAPGRFLAEVRLW